MPRIHTGCDSRKHEGESYRMSDIAYSCLRLHIYYNVHVDHALSVLMAPNLCHFTFFKCYFRFLDITSIVALES